MVVWKLRAAVMVGMMISVARAARVTMGVSGRRNLIETFLFLWYFALLWREYMMTVRIMPIRIMVIASQRCWERKESMFERKPVLGVPGVTGLPPLTLSMTLMVSG